MERPIVVRGQGGLEGTLAAGAERPRRNQTVRVHLARGGDLLVPGDRLMRQRSGEYFLKLTPQELKRFRAPAEPAPSTREAPVVVPVVEERLAVGKRQVETGKVVVRKTVRERREVVDVPLLRETVQVERVAVNRIVDRPVEIRQEGNVLVVPVVEEVLVVEKRLMLREELRITRVQTQAREPQAFTLRREEVQVERSVAEPARKKKK